MLGRRCGQGQNGRGTFGRDGKDAGRAALDSLPHLEGVEIGRKQVEVALADAFGKDDAVGLALHDGREITEGQAGIECIHPDVEFGAGVAPGSAQKGQRHVACDHLAVGGDGIFEIEDKAVGARLGPFGELALGIGGNEQEGTHASALSSWGVCASAPGGCIGRRSGRAG